MADREHRATLAKLGLRRAEDFRWDSTARRTLEIYRAAIVRRAGTRRVPRRAG
jgi:glycosyltransferase involved in cell wall biosynthesis